MFRIVDFIEQYGEYNLNRRFPKGTNVVFTLPKKERFDVDDQDVVIAEGYIYSHDDNGYEILFENEYIHVPYENVTMSVAEKDKFPISDSVISAMPFMKSDNMNSFVKKLIVNFKDLDVESAVDVYEDVQKALSGIEFDENTELMVVLSDDWDEMLESSIRIGEYDGKCLSYQII